MNRYFNQFQYSLEKDVVSIFGTVNIGGTGAVGTVAGLGVSGVARTGEGAYTITLSGPFNKLLGFRWIFGGGTASGIGSIELVSSLANQSVDIRASQVKIQCYSAAATTADPASGSVLQFEVIGRNSSVGA